MICRPFGVDGEHRVCCSKKLSSFKNTSAERDAGTCTHSGLMAAGLHSKSIAAAQCQFLLPLGERVALSGPLTRDTWLGQPSRSGPWLPGSQCPGTATQGGGAFALRAPLSTTGELGTHYGASATRRKGPAAVPGGQHRHTESCKSNKTKQNKTSRFALKGHNPKNS